MIEYCIETVAVFNLTPEIVKGRNLYVLHLAALTAYQVVMIRFTYRVVQETAASQVRLGDQALLFKQIQGAIYSGDIHVWISGVGLAVDLLGADVVIARLDGLQHQQTLRRQAIASLTKGLAQAAFTFGTHVNIINRIDE